MASKPETLINMSTCEVSFKKSEYAVVVFPSMPETFPTDAHIECRYTITQDYVPTSRDWIGLYKVGWISFHDYLYYDWVSPLKNYEEGKESEGNILFPSHKMPDDDGDFYQFCYVASTGQVKGASTPFQFKKPRADDFVEMVDDENDMLIIHSKTCLLEETLKKTEEEKIELLKKLNDCDQKCSNLTVNLVRLDSELKEEQQAKHSLAEDLELAQGKINSLQCEIKDMILIQDELAIQIKQLTQEKNKAENEIKTLGTEKNDLIEKIKILQNQKDETLGKNKILQEENEMYKSQLSSREKSVFETQKQTEKLRSAIAEVSTQIQIHEQENNALLRKLEKEKTLSASKKDEIARLSEKLRNSEDKLCAAESTKQMLQKELSAYEVTLKKMSSDLEASKGEYLTLKVQLHKITQEYQQNKKTQEEKIEELRKENETLKKETDNSVPAQSVYFLQEAQETLRQRLINTMKQNSELSSQKEELTKKMSALNVQYQELLKERKEWQLRVTKCSEEYKKIYAENKKNIKKLAKLKNSMSPAVDENSESSHGASERGSPSVCGSSIGDANIEELSQELQHEQNKEMKQKNEEKKLSQKKLPPVNDLSNNQPDTTILEQPTLLYGNPYANNEPKPEITINYPYPLPKGLAPKSFDSITSDGLSPYPNQKLPRPIEPTVLPSAKAAALKAVCSPSCEKSSDAHVRFFDSNETTTPEVTVNTDGEQYFEAFGEEMRICPQCDETFALDISEIDFSEHIVSHFGRVCPVCKKITDDEVSQELFEQHVNMCIKCESPEQ